MVAWHVLAGMSGTLMVLPREGLTDPAGNKLHYDRAYTIGEFDLYIPKDKDGQWGDKKAIYARETVLLADYPDTVPVKLQAHRIGTQCKRSPVPGQRKRLSVSIVQKTERCRTHGISAPDFTQRQRNTESRITIRL